MILDATGTPFPTKSIGALYAEAIERSMRDTKWNLMCALSNGWTDEQFRHWVNTGEEP